MGAAGGGAVSSLDEVCVGVKDELPCGGFSQGLVLECKGSHAGQMSAAEIHSLTFGDQKSEIKGSLGCAPTEGSGEGLSCPFQLLRAPGVPWLGATSPQSLSPSLPDLLCAFLCSLFL